MKRFVYFCFVIVAILFTSTVSFALSGNTDAPEIGCKVDESEYIVRFAQDCANEKSDGYFTIPKNNVQSCNITDSNGWFNMSASSETLSKPVLELSMKNLSAPYPYVSVRTGRHNSECKNSQTYFNEVVAAFKKSMKNNELTNIQESEDQKVFSGEITRKNGRFDFVFITNNEDEIKAFFRCDQNACRSSQIEVLNGKFVLEITAKDRSAEELAPLFQKVVTEFENYYMKL